MGRWFGLKHTDNHNPCLSPGGVVAADPGGWRATGSGDVFWDRCEGMRRDSGVNSATLLGTVAAHEIGHLLLGSNAHSAIGIMAPHWEAEQLRHAGMGSLLFTPEQSARMRTRIRSQQARGEEIQPVSRVRNSR